MIVLFFGVWRGKVSVEGADGPHRRTVKVGRREGEVGGRAGEGQQEVDGRAGEGQQDEPGVLAVRRQEG